MNVARLFLAMALCASSVFAQAPGWSRGQQLLGISYDECVRRAPLALKAEGYSIDYAAGAFAVGMKGIHTAVITCNAAPESKQWVNVFVASNGDGGGTERQNLQAQMERANPAGSGRAGGPGTSGRYLTVRVNGRNAIVDWANAPAANRQWVSVVPAGTADGTHVGRWTYTNESSGRYQTGPLDPGTYEARYYGDGGYGQILDRVRFEVSAASGGGGAQADDSTGRMISVALQGRRAVVRWFNAPAVNDAWVSVVPVGTADTAHVSLWTYTRSASGVYETGALAPGDYEARFYGDGGYGKILDRVRFRVN